MRPKTRVTGYDGSRVALAPGERSPPPRSSGPREWPEPGARGLSCRKEKGRVAVNEFLEARASPASGRWATAPPCRPTDRPLAAADGAARAATGAARREEHRGGSRWPSETTLSPLHHRPARVDRPPTRRRKHPWNEFLRLRRLASVARRLPAQLPRLAKKTRVAISWVLEMIFSKDLEQMLTLRDVESIARTYLRSDVAN